MTSRSHLTLQDLPENKAAVGKLRNCLIRNGNRERATSFILDLLPRLQLRNKRNTKKLDKKKLLKKRKTSLKKLIRKPKVHRHTDPVTVLGIVLRRLAPSFFLRRIVRGGRAYDLPVPISQNRAHYLASRWLRTGAFKDTKSSLTVPELLARESRLVLQKKGAAWRSLRAQIRIAKDQRPFTHLMRQSRKFTSVRRSLRLRIPEHLYRKYKRRNKHPYFRRIRRFKGFLKTLLHTRLKRRKRKIIRVQLRRVKRIKSKKLNRKPRTNKPKFK
jgi:ribosomal protein S7